MPKLGKIVSTSLRWRRSSCGLPLDGGRWRTSCSFSINGENSGEDLGGFPNIHWAFFEGLDVGWALPLPGSWKKESKVPLFGFWLDCTVCFPRSVNHVKSYGACHATLPFVCNQFSIAWYSQYICSVICFGIFKHDSCNNFFVSWWNSSLFLF